MKRCLARVSTSLAADADRCNINYYNAYFVEALNRLTCRPSDDWWLPVIAASLQQVPASEPRWIFFVRAALLILFNTLVVSAEWNALAAT